MTADYETELVQRPEKQRRRERIAGIVGLVLAALLIGGGLLQRHDDGAFTFATLLYPCILVVLSVFLLRKSRAAVDLALTPTGIAQKASDEVAAQAMSAEFWNRWYLRYPVAALCFAGAWLMLTQGGSRYPQWLALTAASLLAVMGIWKAREVSLPLLGIGAIWLVFSWLRNATLSVPAAIIIGAVIIAMAISSAKR